MTDKQSALRRLKQADFVLLEAGLYLNGYPTCMEASLILRKPSKQPMLPAVHIKRTGVL